jgi:hypothetical protein
LNALNRRAPAVVDATKVRRRLDEELDIGAAGNSGDGLENRDGKAGVAVCGVRFTDNDLSNTAYLKLRRKFSCSDRRGHEEMEIDEAWESRVDTHLDEALYEHDVTLLVTRHLIFERGIRCKHDDAALRIAPTLLFSGLTISSSAASASESAATRG